VTATTEHAALATRRRVGSRRPSRRWPARCPARLAAALAGLALGATCHAADPVRGGALYANPPQPGLLACIDCHGDNPSVNNFGRIWTGRNAVALIQRAVANNTGGMGYFQSLYGPADFADIAAWLGNWPPSLSFPLTRPGLRSPPQTVTVASSTSLGLADLRFAIEGDFAISGGDCGAALERFSSCTVDVEFRPGAPGLRRGALLVSHDGTPSPIRLPLAGEGAEQPQAVARVTPKAIDFGGAVAALPGAIANVTLANDSGVPLTVSRVAVEGGAFRLVGSSCVVHRPLAAGTACVLGLRFEPTAPGRHTGRLVIAHDGVDGQSTVSLGGRAAAGPASRVVADRRAAWDLGAVAIGSVGPVQVATLRNVGNQAWSAPAATSPGSAFTIEHDGCSAAFVAPGTTCQVAFAFRPAQGGPASAELRIGDEGPLPTPVVRLAGRSPTGGALSAVPWTTFDGRVGRSTTQTVRVVNGGLTGLVLSALAIEGDGAASFTLAAGGSCRAGAALPPASGCDASVRYRPAAAGAQTARLRVVAEGGAAATVALAGQAREGDQAALWIDASALDFGEQAVGARSQLQTVAVHNRGGAALELEGLRVAGDAAHDFEIGGDCRAGVRLPAGSQCTVELRFAPRDAGSRLATLQLPVAGMGAPALVSLAGRASSPASAQLVFDRPWLRFPPQPVALPGAARRIVLRNIGGSASTAPRLELDGPFELLRDDPDCRRALPAGSTCTFDIVFRPTTEGRATGDLRAHADGATAASLALDAQATAQAAVLVWQPPPPARTHAAVAVGEVEPGAWWTVVNAGNADSAPLAWTIVGDAARDFSLDAMGSCAPGTVLAPGASCRLRVAFHPSVAGDRVATLALAGLPTPLEATLAGRGLAAAAGHLVLSPTALDFAATPGEVPAAQSILLFNAGSAALRVDGVSLQGQAFEAVDGTSGACPHPPFALLPGQSCAAALRWSGSSSAALGGALGVTVDGAPAAAVANLSVSEDAALRSNVGAGAVGVPALIALALAVLYLRAASAGRPRRGSRGGARNERAARRRPRGPRHPPD
jgi:hypothetical protein